MVALADGASHPRGALAAALACSRPDLDTRLRELAAAGLPWQAGADDSVALPWPLELLDAAGLRGALTSATRAGIAGLDVLWSVDSTSSELRRRDATGRPAVVFAEYQRAGRGRRGRDWLAPPGLNICMSCARTFRGGLRSLAGLSLAVGVMLVEALAAVGVAGVGLKWPNDVLLDGGKLAGILVEADGAVDGACRAIVGVGVNLRVPEAVRVAAGQPVRDLAERPGGSPSRHALAVALVEAMAAGLARFEESGFAAFAEAWARHDVLRGRTLDVQGKQGAWRGTGAGVDAQGALRLATPTGLRVVDSAEVSVRRA